MRHKKHPRHTPVAKERQILQKGEHFKMKNSFVHDRDEALLSLDEKKIRAFTRKYNISISDNPIVFWASVYKAVLAMKHCPEDIRKQAGDWLDSHGFQRGFGNCTPVQEKVDRYPRHTFEHVIFPAEFYRWGDKLLNQVIDGDRRYMADLYSYVEPDTQAMQPYKANFFKVLRRNYGEATIVRLDLPKPVQVTECRRIYLCRNEHTSTLMYFTSELSMEGTYYLCAWTKGHCHLLLDSNHVTGEFDHVAELFKELAGFEPKMTAAV